MSGSGSFRATVQPLVRSAALRGASVAEVTRELRVAYGHAYRRTDLLSDIRAYRAAPGAVAAAATSAAIAGASIATAVRSTAISSYRDMRGLIARVGVAVFSISLLLPTIVHRDTSSDVMIASSIDQPAVRIVEERAALPNARAPRIVVSTPEPT